jgi:23S rRNA pseudouridine1911/1915/1917 synthase
MRWIIRHGDGHTVREVLARAGVDSDAVVHGRVFVGPRRVQRDGETVRVGEVLTVAEPRSRGDTAQARLLVHAGDLVAADKPAGIPTIADHAGSSHALVATVARALGIAASRVHPTSRLDRDVSGVVIFALSAAAAERLVRARAEGTYLRRYVAIATRAPTPERGEWNTPIGRARDPRLRQARGPKAVAAITQYAVTSRTAEQQGAAAMLAISPVTGRTHQIRVHAADAGAPLLGDRAYGGPLRVTLPSGRVLEPGRIALHCARVAVSWQGGGRGENGAIVAASPQPAELSALWSALGGQAGAWEGAVSCALP